jgi:hypothetical protein
MKPDYPRNDRQGPPGPVDDVGQEGEYVVEQRLNRRAIRGREHYLVQWQGHDPADDSWEPEEHLTYCSELVAENEAALAHRSHQPRLNDHGAAFTN